MKRRTVLSGFAMASSVLGVCLYLFQGQVPFASAMTQAAESERIATTAPVRPAMMALHPVTANVAPGSGFEDVPPARHGTETSAIVKPNSDAPVAIKPDCTVVARAIAAPLAMADLSISAPCHTEQWVTVHNNGLVFSAKTDEAGDLKTRIPVFAERSVVIFQFADGIGTTAAANVPNAQTVDRVALQWAGQTEFRIHATHPSFDRRDVGAQDFANGPDANDTHVVRLGDAAAPDPRRMEVLTLLSQKPGAVDLSLDVEITHANCNRTVEAQSISMRKGRRLQVQNIVLTMPDCAAVGDFLVLNFPAGDLTVAQR